MRLGFSTSHHHREFAVVNIKRATALKGTFGNLICIMKPIPREIPIHAYYVYHLFNKYKAIYLSVCMNVFLSSFDLFFFFWILT